VKTVLEGEIIPVGISKYRNGYQLRIPLLLTRADEYFDFSLYECICGFRILNGLLRIDKQGKIKLRFGWVPVMEDFKMGIQFW
jgi:hypothetical protein